MIEFTKHPHYPNITHVSMSVKAGGGTYAISGFYADWAVKLDVYYILTDLTYGGYFKEFNSGNNDSQRFRQA
jgi:hypothetical protein